MTTCRSGGTRAKDSSNDTATARLGEAYYPSLFEISDEARSSSNRLRKRGMMQQDAHILSAGAKPPTEDRNSANMRWYVVQTHRHSESLAEQNLRQQNFSTYLPKRQRTVRHARRIRTAASAYFDCYLFVSLDIQKRSWSPINSTVGVRKLVMNNSAPVPVPHGIIESLISATDEHGILHPASLLHPGTRIRIVAGAFANQLGILDHVGRSGAVRILMNIMNRAVAIHIDRADIFVVS